MPSPPDVGGPCEAVIADTIGQAGHALADPFDPEPAVGLVSSANDTYEYEVFVHPDVDTDQPLPMIIALHGRGGSPEWFLRMVRNHPLPVRWVFPRAPRQFALGRSWFSRSVRRDKDTVTRELGDVTKRLAVLLDRLPQAFPTTGRPIVVGYSQGGILAWSLAVHYGEQLDMAVPIAGFLPPSLLSSSDTEQRAPVVALHGRHDRTIRLRAARQTVRKVKRTGGASARLRTYQNAGHELTPKMRTDLVRLLRRAVGESGRLRGA